MSTAPRKTLIEELSDSIQIPESAYEKAEARYKDLGGWFERPESTCLMFDPHIYPQGSFRLGTVTRPITESESYDLDLGARLCQGITKKSHTQHELKALIGDEMSLYRKARQIQHQLEEKRRCWRLEYADELNFHMDCVPSIPETEQRRLALFNAMRSQGSPDDLAINVASHAGAITDKSRLPQYDSICDDWLISNSEGFAVWFESRMKLANELMRVQAFAAGKAQIDELPARQWKSPLQRCIQLLKRHRDCMFERAGKCKPISVILTTLAARAYQGEPDLNSSMTRILAQMGQYVNPTNPRVPNPVNPQEDFADKWSMPAFAEFNLEQNFWLWLRQAQADFASLMAAAAMDEARDRLARGFKVSIPDERLQKQFPGKPLVVAVPSVHVIKDAPRPWCRR